MGGGLAVVETGLGDAVALLRLETGHRGGGREGHQGGGKGGEQSRSGDHLGLHGFSPEAGGNVVQTSRPQSAIVRTSGQMPSSY